jgi:hypothetical protein
LFDLIELVGGGQVGQVARVNDEVGCVTEVIDPINRLAERAGDIWIGRTGETDMAVADLSESQGGPGLNLLGFRGTMRCAG